MTTRSLFGLSVAFFGLYLGLATPAAAEAKCPADSVQVGPVCVDTFEASVWETTDRSLIERIRRGIVTEAQLMARGATQLGLAAGDLAAAGCPVTGNGCVDFYAVSIPGVTPSRFITWFQAAAAARNADKRLPSNAEWQAAALGTPDPGVSAAGSEDCNTANSGGAGIHAVVQTGFRSNCVSDVGAFDMVGNVWEWVADWVPSSAACVPALFAGDLNCLAGASITGGPGALVRGGDFIRFAGAGVFAVQTGTPSFSGDRFFGFRAAR